MEGTSADVCAEAGFVQIVGLAQKGRCSRWYHLGENRVEVAPIRALIRFKWCDKYHLDLHSIMETLMSREKFVSVA